MENLIILALTTLATAFVGSYLGAYLKKKGENLATHEDIDNLVEQVRAVTTTTKEIEAKISSDVWDRQKRWELKRDVLFEAMKRLSETEDALHAFASMLNVDSSSDEVGWNEQFSQRAKRWNEAMTAFQEAHSLVAIVCSEETTHKFSEFSIRASIIADDVSKKSADAYANFHSALLGESAAVTFAIRKELGIDKPA